MSRVALACRHAFRRDSVDFGEVRARKREFERFEVFFEMRLARGAWNRDDVFALCEHPGKRQLRE